MAEKYTVKTYNTISEKYESVEVSEEVYHAFMRTGGNIADNNESFYTHEIQMSALIGGENGAYLNFREFIEKENQTEKWLEEKLLRQAVQNALAKLNKSDRALIFALYFCGLSEREYAAQLGIYHNAVHKRKMIILKKLKN